MVDREDIPTPEDVAETAAHQHSNQFLNGLSDLWETHGDKLKKVGIDGLSVVTGVIAYEIMLSVDTPTIAALVGSGAGYIINYATEVKLVDRDRTLLPPMKRWLAEAFILGMLVLVATGISSAASTRSTVIESVPLGSPTPTETVTPTSTPSPTEYPTMTSTPAPTQTPTLHPVDAMIYGDSTHIPPAQAAQVVQEVRPIVDQMVEDARQEAQTRTRLEDILAGLGIAGALEGVRRLFGRRR
jgi:hypothetical protein